MIEARSEPKIILRYYDFWSRFYPWLAAPFERKPIRQGLDLLQVQPRDRRQAAVPRGVTTFTAKEPNSSAMHAVDSCGTLGLFQQPLGDRLKLLPLFLPFDGVHELPQVPLINAFYRRQEQNLLLNVRREVQQFRDLRYSGTRHVAKTGHFGVIPERAIIQ